MKTGYKELIAYWDNRAKKGKTPCEKVEFSRRTQKIRFEAFLSQHDLSGKSVLDVGCGMAGFWEHLDSRGIDCKYAGVDISKEMIRQCRLKFPTVRLESADILKWTSGKIFDYTAAFGIHNIKLKSGGYQLLKDMMRRQFELCKIAAHISLLTDRFTGFSPHIQAWRAEKILTEALKITPYVTLRHDYLPNDFSVTLYRKPLIDTHKKLVSE